MAHNNEKFRTDNEDNTDKVCREKLTRAKKKTREGKREQKRKNERKKQQTSRIHRKTQNKDQNPRIFN